MAFNIKTWTDRVAEHINRRILTHEDGTEEIVTVARSEGTVSQEGDAFDAQTMNDLERRIADEFNAVNENLNDVASYSENEVCIGTFDNKPLYRRIFKDISWNVVTTSWTVITSILDIETIVTLRGILHFNELGYQRPIPQYESANNYALMDFQNGNIVASGNGWQAIDGVTALRAVFVSNN